MSVVKIDERGRMTVPKELGARGRRAVILPAGSFFIVIPLPEPPTEGARGWLSTKRDRRGLKDSAEKAAKEDAVKRAKRRKQI